MRWELHICCQHITGNLQFYYYSTVRYFEYIDIVLVKKKNPHRRSSFLFNEHIHQQKNKIIFGKHNSPKKRERLSGIGSRPPDPSSEIFGKSHNGYGPVIKICWTDGYRRELRTLDCM